MPQTMPNPDTSLTTPGAHTRTPPFTDSTASREGDEGRKSYKPLSPATSPPTSTSTSLTSPITEVVEQFSLQRTRSASSSSSNSDTSEYHPSTSPQMAARKTRTAKRSRAAEEKAFTLPPPPTRTRRIIQMKLPSTSTSTTPTQPSSSSTSSTPKAKEQPVSKEAVKEKRKISRKTAHSVIERRRRGKMNEAFEELKELVPACREKEEGKDGKGRERGWHKLEVLREGVGYIRHLETCIGLLKDELEESKREKVERFEDGDTEMDVDTDLSPSSVLPLSKQAAAQTDALLCMPAPRLPPTPKLSPAILPQIDNASPPITSYHSPYLPASFPYSMQRHSIGERHYSFSSTTAHSSHSAQTTPLFGPQRSRNNSYALSSGQCSALTSPALAPVLDGYGQGREGREVEEGVAGALLMLNGVREVEGGWRLDGGGSGGGGERRESAMVGGGRRGLSVRDLLSG